MNFHLNGIWGWLLKPLLALCMGMSFAASGTALGGDMGGGGMSGGEFEGGGDGEGEGGDEFGGEGGSGEHADDAGDLQEGLGADRGENEGQTPEQRRIAAAESRLPAGLKKAIASLREGGDQKTAELIRKAYFGAQAWGNIFPTGIRQAREMVQAFDDVGGVEGIRGLQDEVQNLQSELDNTDNAWKEGKPEFIAGLAEEDPEAFARNVPLVLEQFFKSDPDGYSAVTARIFYNTMTQKGVVRYLEQMLSLANANKTAPGMAGIFEGISQVLNWTDSIRDMGARQPERKPDKGMERLRQRETEFERKQAEGFKADVGKDIKSHLEGGILREVGKLLKARGVNIQQLRVKEKDRFESMVAEADRRLTMAINKDRAFHQQKDRLMATKDKERVVRFYQQKIDSLLTGANGIAKQVANIFFKGYKPAARPGANGQGGQNGGQRGQNGGGQNGGGQGGGGVQRVSQAPDRSKIDWSRTSDDDILDGQAYLKKEHGGKMVKWRG